MNARSTGNSRVSPSNRAARLPPASRKSTNHFSALELEHPRGMAGPPSSRCSGSRRRPVARRGSGSSTQPDPRRRAGRGRSRGSAPAPHCTGPGWRCGRGPRIRHREPPLYSNHLPRLHAQQREGQHQQAVHRVLTSGVPSCRSLPARRRQPHDSGGRPRRRENPASGCLPLLAAYRRVLAASMGNLRHQSPILIGTRVPLAAATAAGAASGLGWVAAHHGSPALPIP